MEECFEILSFLASEDLVGLHWILPKSSLFQLGLQCQ